MMRRSPQEENEKGGSPRPPEPLAAGMRLSSRVPVRIKRLHDDVVLPAYGREGDAGLDVRSREDKTLAPGERYLFRLGFCMEIPPGYVALGWDRSGLAAKHGVTTLAGVIDHTYRGELMVTLANLGSEPYEVKRGDRISQILIQPICTARVEEAEELGESNRGESGFGSSGR